jgi:hypothetical protein
MTTTTKPKQPKQPKQTKRQPLAAGMHRIPINPAVASEVDQCIRSLEAAKLAMQAEEKLAGTAVRMALKSVGARAGKVLGVEIDGEYAALIVATPPRPAKAAAPSAPASPSA